ncbi:GNAT family N-acetyltransferase [Geothrix sp. 21YS21S-2]|uniref:GNAT family N-acetyltransferase n=1 Tax=Geothrix sp. 21YS21S-2 TaxID=3068893 RepID=UPI0027BAECD8|nr:GNAT family N-acetyltransferase [Geothrix sp. 21YS21S-2]
MGRISRFLDDLLRLRKEQGVMAALHHLRQRISYVSETLLFERYATGAAHVLPEGMRAITVHSEEDPGLDLLRRSGGELNPGYFRRSAVAGVLCVGDEAVGHRWEFPYSPLARHLGPNATYFGKAFVRPEFRGKGYNRELLRFMEGRLPKGTRILMEVDPANVSSQRSLLRAGSTLVGTLQVITIFTILVRVRIRPAA